MKFLISNNSPASTTTSSDALHEVIVEEILTTDKYAYLNVKEKNDQYWIAISKREVKVGDRLFFKGGLLKKNFFSREFNRIFETVYLVSKVWEGQEYSASTKQKGGGELIKAAEALPNLKDEKIELATGAISLAKLFKSKSEYQGKKVKISGKCVKVNPKIMNRNWLHIQDGSGEGLDLTVTTNEDVPLGAIVALEGVITLDKDFGAGYRYDIIMENAVVVPSK